MLVASFDYRFLKVYAGLFYAASLILLVLVRTPLGTTVKGSQRWFEFAGFQLAPSEIAKIAVICMLAAFLSELRGDLTLEDVFRATGLAAAARRDRVPPAGPRHLDRVRRDPVRDPGRGGDAGAVPRDLGPDRARPDLRGLPGGPGEGVPGRPSHELPRPRGRPATHRATTATRPRSRSGRAGSPVSATSTGPRRTSTSSPSSTPTSSSPSSARSSGSSEPSRCSGCSVSCCGERSARR